MNRSMMLAVLVIIVACCSALAAQKKFEGIETFPEGKQEGALGTILGTKDVNTVTVTLSAPYAAVWSAVKSVARKFDKVGNRPVIGIDEQSGRVQNGKISSDSLIGSGNGLNGAWADEFITEATRATSTTTRLSVTRKLVQKGGIGNTNPRWETRGSNGKLERWLITEVIKEINAPHGQGPSEPSGDASTSTYISKDNDKNYIDLNGDGTFRLVRLGKQVLGQYTIKGQELTLTAANQVGKSRMVGDSLIDPDGKEWVRKGNAPKIPPSGKTGGDTSFTNTDIIKLVEAKLPDSVIISKIKASSCSFDVTTDGLIKLKQANTSDAVVQAVIDCKP